MGLEKTLITKEKEDKMGHISTMKTNSKRRGLRIGHLECTITVHTRNFRITINELRKYKIAIAAIQETRWNKLTPQAFTSNFYNIYTSSLANNHEFDTVF
jgi:hypothetical protein